MGALDRGAYVLSWRRSGAYTSVDLDQRIAAARQSLDAATCEQGWAEGRSLSLDDAIAVALDA